MADLMGYLFWGLPVFILVAELIASVWLSRIQFRRRRLLVLGSYLLFVALGCALPFLAHGQDEFGYSIVPALLLTAPWYFIPGLASGALISGEILAGIILNCAIFLLLDRLSYSKHTDRLTDATYRS